MAVQLSFKVRWVLEAPSTLSFQERVHKMTDSKPKTILIVEDEDSISMTLSIFLEGEGYQTLLAENGLVALELIQKHGLPDLILLDMKMPIMNGWQFAVEF